MKASPRLLALAALLLLSVGALFMLLRAPAATTTCTQAPTCADRHTNAAWLGVEWVNEQHEASEVARLARDLHERGIRHAYVYASYLKPDGRFNPTYSQAADFTRALHALDPDLDVQAWLGLPLKNGDDTSAGYVDLTDAATRRQVAEFAQTLVTEHGFDGVHLDPEPVVSGDAAVLALLDDVRAAIGPDKTLSMATRRIQPAFLSPVAPLLDHHAWRPAYYQAVAKRVKQMAPMIYDSGLPTPGLYRWWTMRQVVDISAALQDRPVDVFFGVPTSEEATRTHRPDAENTASGLQGVVDGLSRAEGLPAGRLGVAVYPYWETDEAEWSLYRELWLGE